MKGTEAFKDAIERYVTGMADSDAAFAEKAVNPAKNIDDCVAFILNEVQKSGINGFTDEEVYSIAVHYYVEDNVFIMGLCEGNFPNPFFCQNLSPQEQQEFFNNEWKKMYVAATRARKNLYLTYSANIKRKGYSFHKAPSRFITNQLPA